jgi:hypothetical protein
MAQAVQSLIDSGGNTTILVYSGAAFLALATIMMDKHDTLKRYVFFSINKNLLKPLSFSTEAPPVDSLICQKVSMFGFGIISIVPFLIIHATLIKKIFISQLPITELGGYSIGFYFEDILVCMMLIISVFVFIGGLLIGKSSLKDRPINEG